MEAHQTSSTVELNTTPARTSDLYGDASEGCQHCRSDEFLMVEINASRGQRKRVQACRECAEDYREAPRGLYDPTVLGSTDGANFDS